MYQPKINMFSTSQEVEKEVDLYRLSLGANVLLAAECAGVSPEQWVSNIDREVYIETHKEENVREGAHISFLLALGEDPFAHGYCIKKDTESELRFWQSDGWVKP
jgi:hypothetical protein